MPSLGRPPWPHWRPPLWRHAAGGWWPQQCPGPWETGHFAPLSVHCPPVTDTAPQPSKREIPHVQTEANWKPPYPRKNSTACTVKRATQHGRRGTGMQQGATHVEEKPHLAVERGEDLLASGCHCCQQGGAQLRHLVLHHADAGVQRRWHECARAAVHLYHTLPIQAFSYCDICCKENRCTLKQSRARLDRGWKYI